MANEKFVPLDKSKHDHEALHEFWRNPKVDESKTILRTLLAAADQYLEKSWEYLRKEKRGYKFGNLGDNIFPAIRAHLGECEKYLQLIADSNMPERLRKEEAQNHYDNVILKVSGRIHRIEDYIKTASPNKTDDPRSYREIAELKLRLLKLRQVLKQKFSIKES